MRNLLLVLSAMLSVAFAAEAVEWETDFAKASARAKESGRYILLNFSGSDWCGWCVKLDKEVFSTEGFRTYADRNLVAVLLDFPRRKAIDRELKKQNEELRGRYGVRGFPTVIILSPDGELVGRTGYRPGGQEKYTEHLDEMIGGHREPESGEQGAG